MISKDAKDARALYVLSRLYKHIGKTADWNKYKDEANKADPGIASSYPLPELDMEETLAPLGGDTGSDKTTSSSDSKAEEVSDSTANSNSKAQTKAASESSPKAGSEPKVESASVTPQPKTPASTNLDQKTKTAKP